MLPPVPHFFSCSQLQLRLLRCMTYHNQTPIIHVCTLHQITHFVPPGMKSIPLHHKLFSCSVQPKHLKEKAGSGSRPCYCLPQAGSHLEQCSSHRENNPLWLSPQPHRVFAASFTKDHYYVNNLTKGFMNLCAAACCKTVIICFN